MGRNVAMRRKVNSGEAVDVGGYIIDAAGHYLLPPGVFVEGKDYCDMKNDVWIWSIGRHRKSGIVTASPTGDLYNNPAFECLWLR